MSELSALQDQLAELNQNMMAVNKSLGELLAKAHTQEGCLLNVRLQKVEKQQNRWAGGLALLLPLVSILAALVSFVAGKLWR